MLHAWLSVRLCVRAASPSLLLSPVLLLVVDLGFSFLRLQRLPAVHDASLFRDTP